MSSKSVKFVPISAEEREERREYFGSEAIAMLDITHSTPINMNLYVGMMPPFFDRIVNFELREEDVFVVTFVKCGTTWTQELVWLLTHELDFERCGSVDFYERTPFLEMQGLIPEILAPMCSRARTHSLEIADHLESPRVIKSHLPFEMLPSKLTQTCKVVYVCRNPKDVCVSFYYHMKAMESFYQLKVDFPRFVELFVEGKLQFGNYFDHLKSGWAVRHEPNVRFLWYEDMKKDLKKISKDLSDFLQVSYSDEQLDGLVDFLTLESMRDLSVATALNEIEKDINKKFFRKGVVGDWKKHWKLLSPETIQKWEQWVAEELQGTDIVLPKDVE